MDTSNFKKELDVEEEREAAEQDDQEVFGADDYNDDSEEDDDSVIGGDLDSDMEEGEDEIEEELGDEELAALAREEKADRRSAGDIENDQNDGGKSMPDKKAGKKSGPLGKRKRKEISLEYEEEHETERVPSKRRAEHWDYRQMRLKVSDSKLKYLNTLIKTKA